MNADPVEHVLLIWWSLIALAVPATVQVCVLLYAAVSLWGYRWAAR